MEPKSSFCQGNQGDANFQVSLQKYFIPAALYILLRTKQSQLKVPHLLVVEFSTLSSADRLIRIVESLHIYNSNEDHVSRRKKKSPKQPSEWTVS